MLYNQVYLTLGYLIVRCSALSVCCDFALTDPNRVKAHEVRLIGEGRFHRFGSEQLLLLVLPDLSLADLAEVEGDAELHAVLCYLLQVKHFHF